VCAEHFRCWQYTDEDLAKLLKDLDLAAEGAINYLEFVAAAISLHQLHEVLNARYQTLSRMDDFLLLHFPYWCRLFRCLHKRCSTDASLFQRGVCISRAFQHSRCPVLTRSLPTVLHDRSTLWSSRRWLARRSTSSTSREKAGSRRSTSSARCRPRASATRRAAR
jgi:hypothetical protein